MTASFDDRQLIDVQLPQARGDSSAAPLEKEDSGLILVLLKDGSIRWQDNVFTLEELTPLLAQLPEETRLNSFTIQADQEVSMEAGLQLLGELKLLAGVRPISRFLRLPDPPLTLSPLTVKAKIQNHL